MKEYTLYVFKQKGTGKVFAAYYPTGEFTDFYNEGIFKPEKFFVHQTAEDEVMPSVHLILIVLEGQKIVYVVRGAEDSEEALKLMNEKIHVPYQWNTCVEIRYGLNELKFKL